MARVSIVRCHRYEEAEVLKALRRSIDLLGGMGTFVHRGDRVLLKPNLLYGKRPECAVTTHPSIIKAVIQLVQEAGGLPFLGDSPAIGSAKSVAEKAGIQRVAEEMGCPIIEFNRPVPPSKRIGRIFKKIEIDQAVFEADVVINLPKWKTHGQMLLTLGVKNLFGCIPGTRKAMWHLKAGEDPYRFAQVLIDLYQIVQPRLTILDGILGMEGSGPNSGDPISLGLLLASPSSLSLDQVVCDLLGLPRRALLTNRVGLEQGIEAGEIRVVGEGIGRSKIDRFKLPSVGRTDWSLPSFLKKGLKNALQARPVLDSTSCVRCLQCVEVCPPGALRDGVKGLSIDEGRCIHCFCCQEVCPQGAIKIRPGWATRWLDGRSPRWPAGEGHPLRR
ncbi:MAG: DUF362 domain-containing protein [Desulfobacterota bacterium]|nr:DUF362 domain-containing protein [Thermodesulfobacteriota bacterium]